IALLAGPAGRSSPSPRPGAVPPGAPERPARITPRRIAAAGPGSPRRCAPAYPVTARDEEAGGPAMQDSEPSTGPAEGPARSSPTAGSRRTVLRGLGAVSVLGALGAGGHHLYRAVRPEVDPRTVIPLYS